MENVYKQKTQACDISEPDQEKRSPHELNHEWFDSKKIYKDFLQRVDFMYGPSVLGSLRPPFFFFLEWPLGPTFDQHYSLHNLIPHDLAPCSTLCPSYLCTLSIPKRIYMIRRPLNFKAVKSKGLDNLTGPIFWLTLISKDSRPFHLSRMHPSRPHEPGCISMAYSLLVGENLPKDQKLIS